MRDLETVELSMATGGQCAANTEQEQFDAWVFWLVEELIARGK